MLRLHMQVRQPGTERKAYIWKYFYVVKVTRYIVYEENRKPA